MLNLRKSSSWGGCSLSILHAGDEISGGMGSWTQTPLEALRVCSLRIRSSSSLGSGGGGFGRVVSFREELRALSTSSQCGSALFDRFLFLDGELSKSSSMVFRGQAINGNTKTQAEFDRIILKIQKVVATAQ